MTNDACQRYLEDPEANAGHLDDCAECRALFAETALPFEPKPLALDALPLAPWEGASHRSWPVAAGVLAVAIAVAAVLCIVANVTPRDVLQHGVTSMDAAHGFVTDAAGWLRRASRGMQALFAAGVVGVNAILIALLRRAPRGLDA